MRTGWARPYRLACALALAVVPGCDCGSRQPKDAAPSSASTAPPQHASAPDAGALPPVPPDAIVPSTPRATRERAARPSGPTRTELPAPAAGATLDATSAEGSRHGPWLIDSLIDVGPAGPATATEYGAVLVDRDNRLWLAPLRASSAGGPRDTPLLALPDGAGPFPLAHGPSVRNGFAHWVSRGRLFRQALSAAGPGHSLEVLAEDARAGTRVAVPEGAPERVRALRHVAAYIARPAGPDQPASAKLWLEGRPPLALSEDTASAHSVALVATAEGVVALFLEARTGMSSLHRRLLRTTGEGAPVLEPDRVIWVGGPSRASTQLLAEPDEPSGAVAFIALERDITHFGLLRLPIAVAGEPEAQPPEPEWWLYANGIEPSPFATARVCGRPSLVLARPSSAEPHAPQELILTGAGSPSGTPGADVTLIARSQAFFDVSLSAAPGGALLVYVADHRTWARRLRCAR